MLSEQGFKLREAVAEAGIEITPDQLEDGILEASQRITDHCNTCGRDIDCRFGMCFDCFKEAPDDPNS